jgi:hypothetical protein
MSERAALELGRRRAAELARRVQTATDAELGASGSARRWRRALSRALVGSRAGPAPDAMSGAVFRAELERLLGELDASEQVRALAAVVAYGRRHARAQREQRG